MTAVEWLIEELIESQYFPYGTPIILIEEAKEMEYQQIIQTAGYFFHELGGLTPTQYYKETFKNTKE